jgi:hypothetical protein
MTRVTEWVLGVVGIVAAILGAVILFGGDGQSIGLGGDLTWQVEDVAAGWGYVLLIGGCALVLAAGALILRDRSHPQPKEQQRDFASLMWHIGFYLVINAFLWTQDIAAGGGLDYAYWVTVPWGIGLAAHIVAYLVESHDSQRPHQPQPH